jgi:GTP cyclohydrolase I
MSAKKRQSPPSGAVTKASKEIDRIAAEMHATWLLASLGHDVSRGGMKETPGRLVKFLASFSNPVEPKFTTFDSEGKRDMIVVGPISMESLCEHHCAPFFGRAWIGYIPDAKIAGLSKLPRALKYFAHRFQNQERITHQVVEYLIEKLNPCGVGVLLECEHTCMTDRGVNIHGCKTRTMAVRGCFDKDVTRSEFLAHVHGMK